MVDFFNKFYDDPKGDCGNLTNKQCIWFFELCGFDVYINKNHEYSVKDRQGGNLGDIESDTFDSLQEFVNRAWDTYAESYFGSKER